MTAAAAQAAVEEVVLPDLPVVDAHHHLWIRHGQRYLLDEFTADLAASGHRIESTVYVECGAMLRRDGPEHLRSVGEAEFVAGMGAMSDSGAWGPARVCAAFVGAADFTLGARVDEVLDALAAASGGRLRGIRGAVPWDADPVFGGIGRPYAQRHLLLDPRFREGVARLVPRGLVYDAWQYHPQLDELCGLADALPGLTIVVNHCGAPMGAGPYVRGEVFPVWRAPVASLARRPNVVMKLGGMSGMRCGFGFEQRTVKPASTELAEAWRPYMETCIELFGADRCMYESNYPPDNVAGSYRTLWNALKLTAAGCSPAEQQALFAGTARRVYST